MPMRIDLSNIPSSCTCTATGEGFVPSKLCMKSIVEMAGDANQINYSQALNRSKEKDLKWTEGKHRL